MRDSGIDVLELPACPSLTAADLGRFARDGFLVLPAMTTPSEIAVLTELYDALFARHAGWETGDFFDFSGLGMKAEQAAVPQILNPSRYEPRMRDTLFRRNAQRIAQLLIGPSAELVFEHAMMKPAGSTGITTWHQDEAFYPKYTNYKSITFWMPLQPVDKVNGCLEFIPGSNTGPLIPHHSINNDPRIPGLEVDHVDQHLAVACPLEAGDATVHACRTLHYAGPNASSGPRRAYALGFGVRSRAYTLRHDHAWNQEKMTASAGRAAASQSAAKRCVGALKQIAKGALR